MEMENVCSVADETAAPTGNYFPTEIAITWGEATHYLKITNTVSDSCPVYRQEPSTLKFLCMKRERYGKTIRRVNGRWELKRDCDGRVEWFKYGCTPQTDPFGYWSDGLYVTP